MKKRIPIPEEVSSYIEMLNYEKAGYHNLALAADRLKTKDEAYERIANSYIEAHKALEIAKDEFRKAYVPEEYQKPGYIFTFDFNASEIEIRGGDDD